MERDQKAINHVGIESLKNPGSFMIQSDKAVVKLNKNKKKKKKQDSSCVSYWCFAVPADDGHRNMERWIKDWLDTYVDERRYKMVKR